MNSRSFSDLSERFAHRIRRVLRLIDLKHRARVFSRGNEADTIGRIYVINLDRKSDRWRGVRRELDRFRERHGAHLSALVRRYSAVDARYVKGAPSRSVLQTAFTLADQLTVNPNPLLQIDDQSRAREITMTRQEIAVALSHINVWKLIAEGDVAKTLVLEDDVFMAPGFVRGMRTAWSALVSGDGESAFDLLYVAYRDVRQPKLPRSAWIARRVEPGIWEASGYVLTRDGARALLEQLPVRGPVDLWLNFQFSKLRVYMTSRPLVEQRIDEPSTNSYSVLPVLSQVGAVTKERPLVSSSKRLRTPVIGVGAPGTGLSALAEALSMVGYSCLSDVDRLPDEEIAKLFAGRRKTAFNAYVNIESLGVDDIAAIVSTNRNARVICTSVHSDLGLPPEFDVLYLGPDVEDKWAALSEFLQMDYPSFDYPETGDLKSRTISVERPTVGVIAHRDLRHDTSPWILRNAPQGWRGAEGLQDLVSGLEEALAWDSSSALDVAQWKLRDDTFPSNLSLFTPANVMQRPAQPMVLTLRAQDATVRQLTSGAIASRESYLYGSFAAELKPANGSGLITGLFLHRNGPRQEIDIEFLGKDTTKMLVNVYFNPGPDGTKLEYGYRGTPTEIDLGFDAAEDFHHYEIEWVTDVIRWKVDGIVVYERRQWQPTPIPDRALEFNVNLWNSRSIDFAGRLVEDRLPAEAQLRSMTIQSSPMDRAREESANPLDEEAAA